MGKTVAAFKAITFPSWSWSQKHDRVETAQSQILPKVPSQAPEDAMQGVYRLSHAYGAPNVTKIVPRMHRLLE